MFLWLCILSFILIIFFRPTSDLTTLSSNDASVWVKIISSWLCLSLYLWSLVAPILLPDREFIWSRSPFIFASLNLYTNRNWTSFVSLKFANTVENSKSLKGALSLPYFVRSRLVDQSYSSVRFLLTLQLHFLY